jgi:hypothetical protein
MGSIDTATLELLAAWKVEDSTTDPEKLREADEEIAEFKKAMNENRAAGDCEIVASIARLPGEEQNTMATVEASSSDPVETSELCGLSN